MKTQIEVVNQLAAEGEPNIQETKLLSLYLFTLGDLGSAVTVLQDLKKKAPNDPNIIENLGVIFKKSGRFSEAIAELKAAIALSPNNFNIHDALAVIYGKLGDLEKCRHHGETSLLLKDKAATTKGKAYPLSNNPPSPFRWDTPSQNIIAFSLWGKNPRYLDGAF